MLINLYYEHSIRSSEKCVFYTIIDIYCSVYIEKSWAKNILVLSIKIQELLKSIQN